MKYISFVVTSRNDGKSDAELLRMQIFIDSLIEQCARFNLDAELILVEWNPPTQKPSLADVLHWPEKLGPCSVRIIQVPAEIHLRFKNSEIIPLFQMIAKNVGVRRAHGQFVLVTNVDILFSNELVRFLASGDLRPDRMYRIDRFDVPAAIPEHLTLDERLGWCKKNILRVYRYLETVNTVDGVIPPPKLIKSSIRQTISDRLMKRERPLHTNACGDFTLMSVDLWMEVAGNPELPVRAMKLDGLLCYAAHYAGAREQVLEDPMRIYHIEHPARSDGAMVALADRNSEDLDLQVSLAQYQTWVGEMLRTRRPIIFNQKDWGLANEILPEVVITARGQ